jgi:hypothetical protein
MSVTDGWMEWRQGFAGDGLGFGTRVRNRYEGLGTGLGKLSEGVPLGG